MRQRIGNYPGVTVEKKVGQFDLAGRRCDLVDLPGTYSLAPRSPDEMVAVDVLLARRSDVRPVDAVLSIVDASNLERNLYLVSQVLELGLPTVVVLNMVDVARARGIAIDVARLRAQLGVPVVEVQANRRLGLEQVKRELSAALAAEGRVPVSPLPPLFQAEVAQLESHVGRPRDPIAALPRRAVAARLVRVSRRPAVGRIARCDPGRCDPLGAGFGPCGGWPRRACPCRPSRPCRAMRGPQRR